jgi:hypothetical protein
MENSGLRPHTFLRSLLDRIGDKVRGLDRLRAKFFCVKSSESCWHFNNPFSNLYLLSVGQKHNLKL